MRCFLEVPLRSSCCFSARFRFSRLREAVLAVVVRMRRKDEVVIAGVFLRDGAELLPVVRKLHGFHFIVSMRDHTTWQCSRRI